MIIVSLTMIIWIPICAATVSAVSPRDRLIMAQVIWRHGDRAPIAQFQYPNNPNGENLWPLGWSELTQRGMKQQFALGQLLRKRYVIDIPLLNPQYNPKQIYVRSTDVNRTLISATANLAGMFWSAGVGGREYPLADAWPNAWTPVPIHTVPERTDHVCNVLSDCPRADQLRDRIAASREYRAVEHENRGFFRYLHDMSGRNYSLRDVNEITDVIYCEKAHNLTQPHWLSVSVLAQLRNLTNQANRFFHGIAQPYTPELIRIRGGNLLKELIERMRTKLSCDDLARRRRAECQWIHKLKYYAYSAHDTTVAALLSTFGEEGRVIPGGMPHYTASLTVELWMTADGVPAVRVLYLSSSYHDYRVITDLTHGCPAGEELCDLDTFDKRSRKFMPADVVDECRAR